MGNNDWGSPGPTGPAGNPWRQDAPAPSKAGGLATGIIVAAVAVVVLVIGLVAAGVWMWSSQGDGDESASPAFTAVPDDTTSSAAGAESETETPSSVQSSTPPRSPSPSRSPSASPSEPSATSGTPSNLTSQGWRGVSAATCNASDRWVFAGTNGEDHAVVCSVGERGDLYYRGYYNNRAAEYDIDMQRAGSGRWVTRSLDSNGSRVEISGSGVRVVDGDGDSVSSRDFTWSSEDADR
ncbi:hypothetical protein [Corynebacterium glyciniphilum]|uniref:hypothetical protein n=1 Tax=Corynebacterium glyciniphilum TaxID=1404244 RepID=UPI003FCF2CDA